MEKLTGKWVAQRLPKRPKDANKGTFGKVLVFAGSQNYPGAPYLACSAAYRVGAGLVTLVTEPQVKVIVSRKLPEVTFLSLDEVSENISSYNILLIGPGLGKNAKIQKEVLNINKCKVIDGDGLKFLSDLKGDFILTPHPGEMARLTGLTVSEIQSDRINVAQYWAKKWGTVIVLKGANTVVASSAGKILVSPFANPVLATAGTGDVLAGIISGMLAQGLKPFEASCVGVYIHGFAGEMLREKIGDAGALASDLLLLLPQAIRELVNKTKQRVG